jgi:UDP-glucuronate decarboxylase
LTAPPTSAADIVAEDVGAVVARRLDWQALSGRRVVVTGAGGFLGGYLARTLLALHRLGKVAVPVQVVGLVRNLDRARSLFATSPDRCHLELVEWDLNAFAVPELGDVHHVLHAASQASPRFYGTDPVGTMLPNTVGTASLLEALRRSPEARSFLFVSSAEIYGAVGAAGWIGEADYGIVDPTLVRSCYAESKRAGEAMCVAWNHQYGLPAYIVRPFHTYGPGLSPGDGRVFADFAFNVARGENIAMNSAGDARRAFCYVSDAIAGFFSVLLAGDAGKPYNVANAKAELSVFELAELLISLFPERGLSVERRLAQDSTSLASAIDRIVPDTSRLESLGWQPSVSPSEGFRRMVLALAP